MIMKPENSGCLILVLFMFIMITIGAFALDVGAGVLMLIFLVLIICALLYAKGTAWAINKFFDWLFRRH